MAKLSESEIAAIKPKDFRSMVRKGEYTGVTMEACRGYAQANFAIVPKEYAFDFLLFCNRNPRPCPVVDVTEPGDPHPKLMAPEADISTDLPRYRIFQDGNIIDEPIEITKYWRDDLVAFLIGCAQGFMWALQAANILWKHYGIYRSNIPCVPAGRFHGPMAVSVSAFYNTRDAVRVIQISSRYLLNHGSPIYIGNPADIGVENIGQPDSFHPSRPIAEPPKPGEIVMTWGCGVTPQTVAIESKIPLMITHYPSHMFVTDQLPEELAVL